jgi:hypothetical protein
VGLRKWIYRLLVAEPCVVRVMKSRIIWAEVICVQNFSWKPKGSRAHARHRCGWEGSISVNLKNGGKLLKWVSRKWGFEDIDRIHMAQDGIQKWGL